MQKLKNKSVRKNGVKVKASPPLPKFKSLEEEVAFWETHDLTEYRDYWHEVKDVKIDLVPRRLRLEDELAQQINKLALRRGVSSETLVNLWLRQKLSETLNPKKRRRQMSVKKTVSSQYA
jgi:hypothetical protein